MHRLLAILPIVLITGLTSSSAQGLMPPYIQQQLGLTQAWARPLPVPAGPQSISSLQLFVHQENPREYVEIVTVPSEPAPVAAASPAESTEGGTAPVANAPAKVLARIATDQVGANGQPIGRKEAERLANNEIRRLKRKGIEAKINLRTVPRVQLYTIGWDGTLDCRDAETGEPVWMVPVGNDQLPYLSTGISEHFVTVIKGANLMQVDAATGDIIVEVPLPGAASFGAVNTGDFALVPLTGGGIQGYPLSDPTIDPFLERVAGSAMSLPVKSPDSSRTAWSTDRGFVYVIEMEGTPSLLFRLKTAGVVNAPIAAASGDRFFFGSDSGQVYGVRATINGEVMWSQPVGEPFYNEPLLHEDQVLIRSTYGNLFALQMENGHLMWDRPVPGIGDLLGAFDGKLYATTLSGTFMVIDLKSGKTLASYPELRPDMFLVNHLTNRLYLIDQSGSIQCLKPEGADLPTFNRQIDTAPRSGDGEGGAESKEESTETPFGGDNMDPFGAGTADPFGAGGADPFGAGGADPFGEANDAPMNDPFGGGNNDAPLDDPFGGR